MILQPFHFTQLASCAVLDWHVSAAGPVVTICVPIVMKRFIVAARASITNEKPLYWIRIQIRSQLPSQIEWYLSYCRPTSSTKKEDFLPRVRWFFVYHVTFNVYKDISSHISDIHLPLYEPEECSSCHLKGSLRLECGSTKIALITTERGDHKNIFILIISIPHYLILHQNRSFRCIFNVFSLRRMQASSRGYHRGIHAGRFLAWSAVQQHIFL